MNLHLVQATPTETLQLECAAATKTGATAGSAPPPTLLPSPVQTMLAGDMGAEIAALAVKSGQAERDCDSKAAETEDAIQDQADQDQVATMHEEASTTRSGAWESGILQMSAGAFSIGSGAESVGGTMGSVRAADSAMLKGASDGLSGGATLAGGLSKAAATDTEALATAQKAIADEAQRSGATSRDAQKSASDFVQAAIDFYREFQSTKAQEQAAAVHGA